MCRLDIRDIYESVLKSGDPPQEKIGWAFMINQVYQDLKIHTGL